MGEGSPRQVLRASTRTAHGEGWQGSTGPKAGLPLEPQRLPDVEAGWAGGDPAGASGASKQLQVEEEARGQGGAGLVLQGGPRRFSPPSVLTQAGQVLPRTTDPAPAFPRFQKGPRGLDGVSHFPPGCK